MRDKSIILKEFAEIREKVIADPDPSQFRMGWLQAIAWCLGDECP
jgi:hypothetical protein